MPASSKYKALALEVLKARKRPIDSQELASLLGISDSNLASHHLLEFWKNGKIIRSEVSINKTLYYLFGAKAKIAKVRATELTFAPYKRTADASEIKTLILETLDKAKQPLTLAEISKKIYGANYSQESYKKVYFHLLDLTRQNQILRVGEHPYFYTLEKYSHVSIDTSKLSTPSMILSILKESKRALFNSEVASAVKSKFKVQLDSATVSVSLSRLYSQSLALCSKTAYKADAGILSGFVWGTEQALIEKRILQTIPASLRSLLETLPRVKTVSLSEVCKQTKLSPANAYRWIEKLASELPSSIAVIGTSENWSSVRVTYPKMGRKNEVSHG